MFSDVLDGTLSAAAACSTQNDLSKLVFDDDDRLADDEDLMDIEEEHPSSKIVVRLRVYHTRSVALSTACLDSDCAIVAECGINDHLRIKAASDDAYSGTRTAAPYILLKSLL